MQLFVPSCSGCRLLRCAALETTVAIIFASCASTDIDFHFAGTQNPLPSNDNAEAVAGEEIASPSGLCTGAHGDAAGESNWGSSGTGTGVTTDILVHEGTSTLAPTRPPGRRKQRGKVGQTQNPKPRGAANGPKRTPLHWGDAWQNEEEYQVEKARTSCVGFDLFSLSSYYIDFCFPIHRYLLSKRGRK